MYDVQGRLDLNLYVLNSLHHVHVMLVPHALSCASHAVSEVELKGGRAKLRVNAERRFFFCGQTRTSPVLRWWQTRAQDLPARERVAYKYVCNQACKSMYSHGYARRVFPWDIYMYIYVYVCVFPGACL